MVTDDELLEEELVEDEEELEEVELEVELVEDEVEDEVLPVSGTERQSVYSFFVPD